MITDSELDRLLEASSPYAREPRPGTSLRAEADLQRLLDGRSAASEHRLRRTPRIRAWAASAIAIAAVATVVVGVPVVADLARETPPVTAGVPTPDASPADPVQPAPATGIVAYGTLVSEDGSTQGRVDVHADDDSITIELVYLVTPHDELIASGSLTSREDRLCLDDGADVEFGSFRTAEGRYTWLVEGNSVPAEWTALHEIDFAVAAPVGEPASCAATIVARAVLQWHTSSDLRAAEYADAIAEWPEPLPPGYAWPAWSDLPHVQRFGQVGDFVEVDNAAGIYRCILIDAAWHAYFEANDPVASKEYATRADEFVVPDNDLTPTVTQDGVIVDEELARANGLCQGISGDASP